MFESVIEFAKTHSIRIAVILIGAAFLHNFAMIAIKKVINRTVRSENFKTERDEKLRKKTLTSTVNTAIRAVIWVLAILLIMTEFGFNIGPLMAGAGIVGVALGFGAQSIVADFLKGFFILIENHYRVGDVIKINNDVSGTVERVTLRETVLRDLDGRVHHIPNSEIKTSTNMTMEFANVNLDIGVAYETDIEMLEKIVNEVGQSMQTDSEWGDKILEAPKFLRISDFGESAMIIKIVGKTVAMKQWAVTGELRKRLKIAFDKNGVEIPYPQRVIRQMSKK